jgi:hypothetical protein
MGKGIRDTVIDDVMDAYVDWRQESAEVESAYQRWSTAAPPDTALAYAAYVAALDREDRASNFFARVTRHAVAVRRDDRRRGARLRDAA